MRRIINAPSALLVLAMLQFGSASAAAGNPDRPNILFILTDDMGWGDLGVFYQNGRNFAVNRNKPAFATPNLDSLALQGLQMRRHYCPAPVCAPSRASLLCGVHQGHSGVRDNQFDYPLENNHTLATVLRQAGYATVAIGKYGLDGSALGSRTAGPLLRGFDSFFGYLDHLDGHYHYPKEGGRALYDGTNEVSSLFDKCYTTDLWTARAKLWLVNHQATNAAQPFFIYLACDTPHAQLQVPTVPFPGGTGTNGGLQWLGTPGNMINTATGTIDTFIHPDYTNATWDADNNPATPEVPWPVAEKRHATMMRRIDDAVGDLLQTLKDLGCDTNTLVVFTSDNGPHNEAGSGGVFTQDPRFFDSFGPMDGIKRDSWEGGMREPTLVRWPGHIAPGSTNFIASQFHDWLPTFAEVAGLPAPARTDGVSLVPTLTGVGVQRPGTIYGEYYFNGTTPNYTEFEPSRRGAIRNQEQVVYVDGYKGIRCSIVSNTNDFQIYDSLADAKETANLAGTSSRFTSLQQQMKQRILQLRRPLATASRPYDTDLVPPDVASNLVTGLDYAAFEGAFPWVPDFAPMSPVTNGSCTGLALGVRTRDDNIGLFYTGYISIPADGTYTFYLTADSRAFFRIHDASVLDADFGYVGGTELSSSINLKAGWHAFRLSYARGAGGTPALSLQWSSARIPRQPIPAANFLHAGSGNASPPAAFDDDASTPRSTAVTIDALGNDLPGSGAGPLRILSVGLPDGGTATTNLAGQILYTPDKNFLGEDSFTYTITDGLSNATATVRVRVYFSDGDLWFPFNQVSGLSTDEAGGAYTAALVGFTNDPGQWVPGKWNKALQFDGVANQAVITGYKGILGTSNRTVAAWLRTTNVGSFLSWGVKTSGQKWIMRVQNENGAAGALRVEVEGGYIVGSYDLRDGQWHHVAAVFTNNFANVTNIALYVDGARETVSAQSPVTLDTVAGGDLQFGTDIQSRYFVGTLDEVRIFNRALAAGEVASLYSATNQSSAAWFRRYFGNASPNWYADDAGDGGVRLLEYALGAQPWIPDRTQMSLQGAIVADHAQVRFPRRIIGTHELLYDVQVSPDLADWNTLTATEVRIIPLANQPGFETAIFQANSRVSAYSPLYLRLKVAFQ
jgi:arylsulfatase A-like enzyme